MPTNYITLPRSELYELVWTKPVTELAKEFGISDVALAKRCRNLKIPLPPRGHWARVAAGQKPKRPALPKYHEVPNSSAARRSTQPSTEPTVTFDTSRAETQVHEPTESLPKLTTPPATDLASTLSIVRRTARHYHHPRRSELEFPRGEAQGPILRLAVSPDALERALLVADRFLRAAGELGWKPIPPQAPEPPDPRHYYGRPPEPKPKTGPDYAELDVNGKRIEFQIEERYEDRELPPSKAELARRAQFSYHRPEKRFEKIWSGRLRLKRPGHQYPYGVDGKSWFETANRSLDELIPRILADFRAVAARMHEVDEKRASEERERERLAKLAAELSARRAENAKRIAALEAQAGAWHRAQYLRRYLRAARRAGDSQPAATDVSPTSIDFLAWAEQYVNQLDPLHPEHRDPDFGYARDFHYGADEKRFSEELQRLLGHSWESASKRGPARGGPNSA